MSALLFRLPRPNVVCTAPIPDRDARPNERVEHPLDL
jgi:hypothetical protein